MKVCLTNGLQPTFHQAGLEGLWTPMLVPKLDYCEYHCNLCVYVCPTGAIQELTLKKQKIIDRWSRVLDLKYCTSCGVEIAPVFQCDYFQKKANLPEDFFDLCRDCRVGQR